MAVPKNLLKALPPIPKGSPKKLTHAQKLAKLKKAKAKKAKAGDKVVLSTNEARVNQITRDVDKYEGPVKPSERLKGLDYSGKRPTSLEAEVFAMDGVSYEEMAKRDADYRYEFVNNFIKRELQDGSFEDGFDPDKMAQLSPLAQLGIRRHVEGKDIYPNRLDPMEKTDFETPAAGYADPGDQAIPFTPHQLDEIAYGEDAAKQILQNLLERNTAATEKEFGMPVVGRNAEGYTRPSLWTGLIDEGLEAFALPGMGMARGRFSEPRTLTDSFSGFPRGANTGLHEGSHLTYQDRIAGQKPRADIEKYGKDYVHEVRAKQAAKDQGIDLKQGDWYEQIQNYTREKIGSELPGPDEITYGAFDENDEIPRTTWLNRESAKSPEDFTNAFWKMRPWHHYTNNSAEMMADLAPLKKERAYANGVEGRENTYEGDMQLFDDLLKSPKNETEEGVGRIFNALKPEEQDNFEKMWYRLGENKQPNLKQALMS
jgi:hypothetical protein